VKSAAATAASFGSPNGLDDHGSDCGVPQLRQPAVANQTRCESAARQILDAIQTAPSLRFFFFALAIVVFLFVFVN
jgi:hypothetical protein